MSNTHIMMIEFTEQYSNNETEYVALYDNRDMTEQQVVKWINNKINNYNPNIIVVEKNIYYKVFRSMIGETN